MNTKALETLHQISTDKRLELVKLDYFDESNKAKTIFTHDNEYRKARKNKEWKAWEEWNTIGPFTYEEAFKIREFPEDTSKLTVSFIPESLYNKRFTIGDYEISVYHKQAVEYYDKDEYKQFDSRGHYGVLYNITNTWMVFANYHGAYTLLGKFQKLYRYQADYCKPSQTNWFHVKPTKARPYVMKEAHINFQAERYMFLEKFFGQLEIDKLELKPNEIPAQEWYDHEMHKTKRKSIAQLSFEQKDSEWFVQSETKDGIYRPEPATIGMWLFTRIDYSNSLISNNHNKKLFQKLKIHTVQLRADAHFDVPEYFNMTGVKIKAPQKVIEKYGLEKYCKEEKVVTKIQTEKKKREEEELLRDYNNKFTLMQHGKVIKKNKDKKDIIDYLENFSPSSLDFEKTIVESVKPVFNDFQKISKIYIAYWGRYFKYESAGEDCDVSYECDDMNLKHIKKEDWSQIMDLYEENLQPDLDEKLLENKYGWPEKGGIILGVEKKTNGKLAVFTEDYDFE